MAASELRPWPAPAIAAVAQEVLADYVAQRTGTPPVPDDAGPAVLASLLAGESDGAARIAERALAVWLGSFTNGAAGIGVYQGHAGVVAGVITARAMWPRLDRLAVPAVDSLARRLAARRWPPDALDWSDYDLISGPAGAVLALTTDPACAPDLLWPGARLLAEACLRTDLRDLRLRSPGVGGARAWNVGRINTGMGHGLAGVAAALCAACDVLGTPDECACALTRVSRWLADQAYTDPSGLLTWPTAGLDGACPPAAPSRRQAWCYGTPGVSWTLWEAGRLLDDPALHELAVEAMSSFCTAFDEDRYLYDAEPGELDRLAFCHGAAGTLLLADAFARHAGLVAAAHLRDQLTAYLVDRLDEVLTLAGRRMLLLNGAIGALAALLTVGGGSRSWLAQYGLR